MKKKRVLATVFSIIMAFSCLALTQGCAKVVEDVDDSKTQLYVANYNGGVGEKWLDEAVARFEAKYATKSYEKGKEGVQIMLDHSKSYDGVGLATSISTDKYEVYFTQVVDYNDFVSSEYLYDITDVVKDKVNSDDEKTIYSKLSDEMKAALTVGERIYAVPHYELYPGLTYDAGVFESKNLYFSDVIDSEDIGG